MGKRVVRMVAGMLLLLPAVAHRGLAEDGRDRPERSVVHRVQPTYPELARRLNLEGLVTLKAEVAADGHVRSVGIISGNAILGQAAMRTVREWVFAPGAEESVLVGVNFSRWQ